MTDLKTLETALIKPKDWEDNHLYPYLLNRPQAFEAEILDIQKSSKITRIKFFLKNINQIMWGVFFVFKKWHEAVFKKGKTLYIRGEIRNNQLIQPKPISRINEITSVYSSVKIKNEIKKHLSFENLKILPQEIAETLIKMHFPTTLKDIEEKKIEYALKWSEIFLYLYKLQNKKKIFPSNPIISEPTPFIDSLPFKLTNDQLKVIKDIQNDLSKPVQARRVIIGDVGSGKTIVMLSTAFMAKKSAIMAPTSILANQIYEEADKYLNGKWTMENGKLFKVVLVTQKSKFTEYDLKNADLLIGTHALLYQDLPKLNAVMVDEQHRFGTNQRAKLEKLTSSGKVLPHFFQFSATPIPRTQALIMSSFVNVSLIKELPFKKDIDTKIIDKSDFKDLITHIQKEISLGNQVVIVYPLVEESQNFNYQSIEEGKDFWLKYFGGVYITHGKDKNKEDILVEFREKGNILITTTVIEVGISLPRLTTIVIVGAERLGLATLHQLRGRVGRYGQKGYCFLYTNNKNNNRLIEFSKTLDGFKIAELDLKFRKAGDLLDGKKQSGEKFNYFDETKDLGILEDVKRYIEKNLSD
ncbi:MULTISPECIES: ATP-dependent DNA helicase RecG [unclassified Lebetimonas]|uniref:ATP-dependent DNA helicase RecG n=1 Tax=unclassified Lebetimonas TaxID=2648158 RepID=UPI0004635127|nr:MULTISPECIES: ATP-dependent DNA helicase RecG [unclassified Lebetimonas]